MYILLKRLKLSDEGRGAIMREDTLIDETHKHLLIELQIEFAIAFLGQLRLD